MVRADQINWRPGWVQAPLEEQRARVAAICSGDSWILDTAYGDWRDLPEARVELIVALDYPRAVSLARLVRRTARRLVRRTPICNGNVETLRKTLSRDSILLWHFRSFPHKREQIQHWAGSGTGPAVIRLRSPRAATDWLAQLGTRDDPAH